MELSALDGLGWRFNGVVSLGWQLCCIRPFGLKSACGVMCLGKEKLDSGPILQVRVLTPKMLGRRRIIHIEDLGNSFSNHMEERKIYNP